MPPSTNGGNEITAVNHDQLHRAMDELEALRKELQRIEAEEARSAAHVIALVNRREAASPKRAACATTIQAGFHGMRARTWANGVRSTQQAEACAAVTIQAAFHGRIARQATREERQHAPRGADQRSSSAPTQGSQASMATANDHGSASGGHQHKMRNSSYVRGAGDPYGLRPERFGLRTT